MANAELSAERLVVLDYSSHIIRMRTVNRSAAIIFDIMANYRLGKRISLRTSFATRSHTC